MDIPKRTGGVIEEWVAHCEIPVTAAPCRVHKSERPTPHGRSREIDSDVPRATFGGDLYQRSRCAYGTHVPGDVVVDEEGHEKSRFGRRSPRWS